MGKNKKEAFLFTFMMCFLMVVGMSMYNAILNEGASFSVIKSAAIGFLPALIVALLLDLFVVGKLAKKATFRLTRKSESPIIKVLTISLFMVCGMVLCMSLFGTLMNGQQNVSFVKQYMHTIGMNFICALPLQMLVVGPLTRFLFLKMFPMTPTQTSTSRAA